MPTTVRKTGARAAPRSLEAWVLLHAVRKAASTSHTPLSAWYSHLLTGSTLKPSDQEDISLQPEGLFRQWDDRYIVRVSMNMVYVTRLFQNLRNLSGLFLPHHLAISQLDFFDMSKIIHLIFSKHFFFFFFFLMTREAGLPARSL